MKTGFACGVFDLYHAGHALMLQECKQNCEYLVIGLNKATNLSQDKNAPVYTLEERKIILESIKYVDEIVIYSSEEELTQIMEKRNFDVRFLGDDYKTKQITSPELCKSIYFVNRDHGYSTSRIRNLIKKDEK